MSNLLLSTYGLKFHPFRPDVPVEALVITPAVDSFLRRVEVAIMDGGFVMITGEPGTGKSVVLRLLKKRLEAIRDVVVGTIEHPQSHTMDFYRELGDVFGVPLKTNNRWGGFKALRARWSENIVKTMVRPVLILDEAQEIQAAVFNELRILASKDFDSKQLLCVIFSGDSRLPDRFRSPELLPLGSRIRRRLLLEHVSRDELIHCLDHLLDAAGNSMLMTTELKEALVDHAAGNHRVLMNLCDEMLAIGAEKNVPRLDEKLFLETYAQTMRMKASKRKGALST